MAPKGGSRRRWLGAMALLAAVVLVAAFLASPAHEPPGPASPSEKPPVASEPSAPAPPAAKGPPATDPRRAEGTETNSPAPAPEAPALLRVSVEVVDAGGRKVRDGTLHFSFSMELLMQMMENRERVSLLRPQDLAVANPFVVADLPESLGGLKFTVHARVPGLPPSEKREVALEKRGTTEVRLVVAPPRSLEVQVTDALSGGPVAGARVMSITELDRRDLDSNELPADRGPGWATTDAEGRALLTELGPGLHDLQVAAAGFMSVNPRGVDPGPTPTSYSMERQTGANSLLVRIRGPDGSPVPGVRVELVLFDQDQELRRESDAQGVVEFAGLADGHCIARVDFLQWHDLTERHKWPRANVGELNEPLELGGGERKEVVLGFRGGTGVVACSVVDRNGAPVPGVEVTFSGSTYLSEKTDEKGLVEFRGVAAGPFHLSLEGKSDWMETEDRSLEDGGRQELRVVLGHLAIRGRVLRADAEGKGVERATVTLDGPRYGQASTDASGAFEFGEVLPGEYEIHAMADGFVVTSSAVRFEDGKEQPPLEFRLHRGGRIRIRLASSPAAEAPEPSLRVLDRDETEVELRRDETGAFHRESWPLIPGTYTVELGRPDGPPVVRSVEVKGGEDTVVDLGR